MPFLGVLNVQKAGEFNLASYVWLKAAKIVHTCGGSFEGYGERRSQAESIISTGVLSQGPCLR